MCISIVNRLQGDQIETPKELLKLFENRPLQIIVQMIKNRLQDAGQLWSKQLRNTIIQLRNSHFGLSSIIGQDF